MQVNKSPFPTVLELGICGLSNWMAYSLMLQSDLIRTIAHFS